MATKKPTYYFDISKIDKDLLGTRDCSIITNEQAIFESIKNIIYTIPGQNIIDPRFGIGIERFLFDPLDLITAAEMKIDILDGIKRFEDRIKNLEVYVQLDYDLQAYIITILYNIVYQSNSDDKEKMVLQVNRTR